MKKSFLEKKVVLLILLLVTLIISVFVLPDFSLSVYEDIKGKRTSLAAIENCYRDNQGNLICGGEELHVIIGKNCGNAKHNTCSSFKPFFCFNGIIDYYFCSECGCPDGYECKESGACIEITCSDLGGICAEECQTGYKEFVEVTPTCNRKSLPPPAPPSYENPDGSYCGDGNLDPGEECEKNEDCSLEEVCFKCNCVGQIPNTCLDGTPLNTCVPNSPPDYCNNRGIIIKDCNICGCPVERSYCYEESGTCGQKDEPICGDGECNGDETCDSCPDDCLDELAGEICCGVETIIPECSSDSDCGNPSYWNCNSPGTCDSNCVYVGGGSPFIMKGIPPTQLAVRSIPTKVQQKCCISNNIQLSDICKDKTLPDKCSSNKPKYCLNGKLINNCQFCGCLTGYDCNKDGTCSLKKEITGLSILKSEDLPFKVGEKFITTPEPAIPTAQVVNNRLKVDISNINIEAGKTKRNTPFLNIYLNAQPF